MARDGRAGFGDETEESDPTEEVQELSRRQWLGLLGTAGVAGAGIWHLLPDAISAPDSIPQYAVVESPEGGFIAHAAVRQAPGELGAWDADQIELEFVLNLTEIRAEVKDEQGFLTSMQITGRDGETVPYEVTASNPKAGTLRTETFTPAAGWYHITVSRSGDSVAKDRVKLEQVGMYTVGGGESA